MSKLLHLAFVGSEPRENGQGAEVIEESSKLSLQV
jgi:hypothetical protein